MHRTLQSKSIDIGIVLVTLALSALFLARGANAYLARTLHAPQPTGNRAGPHAPPLGSQPPDRCAILERNIFDVASGALCPAKELARSAPPPPPPAPQPDDPLPPCAGEARKLVAAVHSERDPARSFAELSSAESASRLFREGDRVDDNVLFAIYPTAVHLKQSSGQYCALTMFGEPVLEQAPRSQERVSDPAPGSAAVAETRFKVQRALIDSVLQDPASGLRSVRAVPHSEQGKTVGMKLYGIRRDGPLHGLGLQNGDVLRAINGLELVTPDAALEAYGRLRGASNLTVSLERRGRAMTVDYAIE